MHPQSMAFFASPALELFVFPVLEPLVNNRRIGWYELRGRLETGQLMNEIDMRARMARLAKLAQGLAEEASIWKKCDAPVLYVHRLKYVEGIQDAVQGLEGVMAKCLASRYRPGRRTGAWIKIKPKEGKRPIS
jgi:hypothetical protein